MTNIKNELDKLIAYTEGREIITKEDIDAVCSIQVNRKDLSDDGCSGVRQSGRDSAAVS